LLLGSVTEKLIRHVHCPILVLRKTAHGSLASMEAQPPRRILVLIDLSERSRETLRYAVDFAERFDARLTLLHCIPFADPFRGADYPSDNSTLFRDFKKSVDTQIEKMMHEAVPEKLAEGSIVVTGPPLARIPQCALEGKFDLIICARNSSARIRHAILGSTAEGIVRHAACPVLIVPSSGSPQIAA